MSNKFTYPFCYVPHPLVKQAAADIIARIDSSDELRSLFGEGKMLGTLVAHDSADSIVRLYGFSGNVGGTALVPGFVPPLYDLTPADGYYRREEALISSINERLRAGVSAEEASALKAERHSRSVALQDWIFEQYKVSNALGETISVKEVFARKGLVPPGGTGDCAAPKLLQEAYRLGLEPIAMGEFWYGASPRKEVRHQGSFYPSCTGKCGPLLEFMMQGLDVEDNPLERLCSREPRIVYADSAIVVAEKPSGMLSAPGRYVSASMLSWLSGQLGAEVFSCHRLDMDTSGLMVFALGLDAQKALQAQFAAGEVRKMYQARLVPGPVPAAMDGQIDLPLSEDYYDRPRQMVDYESGKPAVTLYRFLRQRRDGTADVEFRPLTGRTHQLRVHAAHPMGLNRPIVGDRLYGGEPSSVADELMLHASHLEFHHPVTGDPMEFDSPLK